MRQDYCVMNQLMNDIGYINRVLKMIKLSWTNIKESTPKIFEDTNMCWIRSIMNKIDQYDKSN